MMCFDLQCSKLVEIKLELRVIFQGLQGFELSLQKNKHAKTKINQFRLEKQNC